MHVGWKKKKRSTDFTLLRLHFKPLLKFLSSYQFIQSVHTRCFIWKLNISIDICLLSIWCAMRTVMTWSNTACFKRATGDKKHPSVINSNKIWLESLRVGMKLWKWVLKKLREDKHPRVFIIQRNKKSFPSDLSLSKAVSSYLLLAASSSDPSWWNDNADDVPHTVSWLL